MSGFLRWFVSLGAAASGAALVLGGACTPFDGADGVADGGATADRAEDAAAIDSGTAEAAAEAGPVAVVIDFEDGAAPAGWTIAGAGAGLEVTVGSSVSGTHALDLTLSADAPVYYSLDLGTARHVAMTANVQVLKRGGGEVDFFGISNAPATDKGLYFVHEAASSSFVFEVPYDVSLPVMQNFVAFTKLRLEVDLATRSYLSQVGGAPPVKGTLMPDAFQTNHLYLLLGAPYALAVATPWHVRFDDIVVETF